MIQVRIDKRLCKECGVEYDYKIYDIMGTSIASGVPYCPDCRLKKEEEEEARRQAQIAHKRKLWRDNCGIPPKFMNQEFGTLDLDRPVQGLKLAYKRCLAYAEKYPLDDSYLGYPSLIIFSENSWGVGKTHLACAIAHKILNRWDGEPIPCPVKYISEVDLFYRIQASYSSNSEDRKYLPGESDIINELIAKRLLIIDDVGKRRVQDPRFVQRIYFAIIDGRYRSRRPIVITSNLNPKKLQKYLGGGHDSASFDRLMEMCQGKALKLEGESYRRKA